MRDHVKIIGIMWIVFGGFSLFGALIIWLILFGVSFIPDIGPVAPGVLRLIGMLIGTFLGLLGIPKIIGGIGLLKGHEWARILTLVISFLSLLNVPFGTALGIYSLIVLFNPETVKLFQSPPGAQPK
jgi:hypothetical protein